MGHYHLDNDFILISYLRVNCASTRHGTVSHGVRAQAGGRALGGDGYGELGFTWLWLSLFLPASSESAQTARAGLGPAPLRAALPADLDRWMMIDGLSRRRGRSEPEESGLEG